MVRAVLYCTVLYCTVLYCAHLAIFMQYTGVFPTVAPRVNLTDSQLKIGPTPTYPPYPQRVCVCSSESENRYPLDLDCASSPALGG